VSSEAKALAHTLLDQISGPDTAVALGALTSLAEPQPHVGPFSRLLGVHFSDVGDGRCTATLELRPHLLNPLGIGHGGVAFSLADTASGGAALSAVGAPRIVTQDMHIRYHGPARPGTITAQAEVVHLGKRTVSTTCRIHQEELLIATVSATFAILSELEMSQIMQKGPVVDD
jgi:acyl-CoA thioesterase